jgi:hypothetical protein
MAISVTLADSLSAIFFVLLSVKADHIGWPYLTECRRKSSFYLFIDAVCLSRYQSNSSFVNYRRYETWWLELIGLADLSFS